jgi:hypothetical protein
MVESTKVDCAISYLPILVDNLPMDLNITKEHA